MGQVIRVASRRGDRRDLIELFRRDAEICEIERVDAVVAVMATAARDVSRASESGRDGCERALARFHSPAGAGVVGESDDVRRVRIGSAADVQELHIERAIHSAAGRQDDLQPKVCAASSSHGR